MAIPQGLSGRNEIFSGSRYIAVPRQPELISKACPLALLPRRTPRMCLIGTHFRRAQRRTGVARSAHGHKINPRRVMDRRREMPARTLTAIRPAVASGRGALDWTRAGEACISHPSPVTYSRLRRRHPASGDEQRAGPARRGAQCPLPPVFGSHRRRNTPLAPANEK